MEGVSIPCHFWHHRCDLVCFDIWRFKQAKTHKTCFGGHHCDFEQHVPCLTVHVCMNSVKFVSEAPGASILWGRHYSVTLCCADSLGGGGVLSRTLRYDSKTANDYQLEHNMCPFILCIYVLHRSSCPRQCAWPAFALPWISTLDERKWYMDFCDKGITQYICYLTQLRILWKYSAIHFHQYKPTPITISRFFEVAICFTGPLFKSTENNCKFNENLHITQLAMDFYTWHEYETFFLQLESKRPDFC